MQTGVSLSRKTTEVPPLPRRVAGYSTGEMRRRLGRRHASVFSSSSGRAVAGARRWARHVTGLPATEANDLELVVSELVTNALRHSASGHPGGFVTVRIAFMSASRIRVSVTDGGPRVLGEAAFPEWPTEMPLADCPKPEHGWGLLLVQEKSRRHGVLGIKGGPLTVWAVLDRADLR